MSMREFTVKVMPAVGSHRASIVPLVPDDFIAGHIGAGSIVTAQLMKVVGGYRHGQYGMPEAVWMQLQAGDHPFGTIETYSDVDVIGSLSMKVPARQGWNVVVGFYYGGHRLSPGLDSVQREGTERHVVLHVTSRPA